MFEPWTEKVYQKKDYPVLDFQRIVYSQEKPFLNLHVLDATPIFRNTLLKYESLIAGGANLAVVTSPLIPADNTVLEILKQQKIAVVNVSDIDFTPDLSLDCAGILSHLIPKFGAVELTRSGVELYQNSKFPVYVADSSEIKKIETSLGTGESYFRAMEQFGFKNWERSKLLVFGYGKVGSGIVHYALQKKAKVSVVAEFSTKPSPKENVEFIDLKNICQIEKAVENADYIVTATGKKNALAVRELQQALIKSKAIMANMGVEDEYGENIPESKILFSKKPLNFSLEEPTHLKFMDATMALHNALGMALVNSKKIPQGINLLPQEIESQILEITRTHGSLF